MPTAILECDMGYPPPNCTTNPYSVDNKCDDAYNESTYVTLTVIGDFSMGLWSESIYELGPWAESLLIVLVFITIHHSMDFVAGTGRLFHTIYNL
jgi:hypothetical protein